MMATREFLYVFIDSVRSEITVNPKMTDRLFDAGSTRASISSDRAACLALLIMDAESS